MGENLHWGPQLTASTSPVGFFWMIVSTWFGDIIFLLLFVLLFEVSLKGALCSVLDSLSCELAASMGLSQSVSAGRLYAPD